MKSILVTFIVSTMLFLVSGNPNATSCPENEVWKECQSSSCGERNCLRSNYDVCTEDCVSKCFCTYGYFRTTEGKCERTCPCGENETFWPCKNVCDSICGKQPEPCPTACFPGHVCTCKTGFSRNAQGACVENSKC